MNPLKSRLQQQEQHEVQQNTAQTPAERMFATPEELLRFDAAQTEVPPGVADRLQESLRKEPKPERSWWQRWFEK